MCRWSRDITYPVMEVTFFAAVKYFNANNANIGNFVLNAKNSIILIAYFVMKIAYHEMLIGGVLLCFIVFPLFPNIVG